VNDADYLRLVSELLGEPLPQEAYVCAYDLLLMKLAEDKDQYRSKFIAQDAVHVNWEFLRWASLVSSRALGPDCGRSLMASRVGVDAIGTRWGRPRSGGLAQCADKRAKAGHVRRGSHGVSQVPGPFSERTCGRGNHDYAAFSTRRGFGRCGVGFLRGPTSRPSSVARDPTADGMWHRSFDGSGCFGPLTMREPFDSTYLRTRVNESC
jgi:hypothetical protein